MNKKVILATLTTITLAACSNDDEQYADFTSPVEVNFSAQVRGTTARTASTRDDNSDETANNTDTWSNGGHNEIGVTLTTLSENSSQSAANFRNIRYTTESTGSTTTKTSFTTDAANKFYFQTPKEYAYFSAYAPYTSNGVDENNNIKVVSGTSNTDGISVPDYIWAETGKLNYSNASPTLAFNHKMAQLQVVVMLGESVSVEQPSANVDEPSTYSSQIESVGLSNITSEGTFNIGTGAVTLGEPKASASLSADNGSEGQTATSPVYTILPQSGITVTITTSGDDNNTYQAVLPELIAGNSYVYTITAQKTEVEVSATIKEWESEEGTLTASMIRVPLGDFTDPNDAWLYDLVFSDGSFKHTTKASGSDFYTAKELALSANQVGEVRGIIFCLFPDSYATIEKDNVLKHDFPDCTHGLILSMNDANSGNTSAWYAKGGCIYSDFQQISDYKSEANTSSADTYNYYCPIDGYVLDGGDSNLGTSFGWCLGYNNTQVLKGFNNRDVSTYTVEDVNSLYVMPVKYVEAYAKEYPAPTGCTDWFLPSVGEFAYFCQANNFRLRTSTVNSIFEYFDETNADVSTFSGKYWTSTEYCTDGNTVRTYAIDTNPSSSDYLFDNYQGNKDLCKTRPICAF